MKIHIQSKKNSNEEERCSLSGGKKESVYQFTPEWLLYRWYAFRDWHKGFAIENFPKHKYTERTGVLDGVDFYDKYSEEHAVEILELFN